MSLDNPTESSPPTKLSASDRLKALVAEWGALLAIVWFGIFALVMIGFMLAIQFGFEVESTAGTWGTLGAAYVATQLAKPLRIAATLVITPALGAFLKRFRRQKASAASEYSAPSAPPAAGEARPGLDERPSEQR
jgi:hypothetical protein